jgi:crotonobetainyl-CoA:carnitine CoA-transferase CaiB-like acyl-CoA transferase
VAEQDLPASDAPNAISSSSYAVDGISTDACVAGLAAATQLWEARGGDPQEGSVDVVHVAAAFESERHLLVDGVPPASPWGRIAGSYRARDGRWVQLHTNFEHHETAACSVLGVDPDRDAVAAAVADWDAEPLAEAVMAADGIAAPTRSTEEWLALPQAKAMAGAPTVVAEPLGPGAGPEPLPSDPERPLGGVRVLDLTRVIAGPVATRMLAAHRADVLRVSAPHLPEVDVLLPDTSVGKRSTSLDLREPADADAFAHLVAGADVVVRSYRPGSLDALGWSAERMAELRPGLVVVSISAYGHLGPWADRRGFDSIVQTGTGIVHGEMQAAHDLDHVRALPRQVLDHATGHLAAAAATRALRHRIEQGGGTHLRLSLLQTRQWLERCGRRPLEPHDPLDVTPFLTTVASPQGEVTLVAPPMQLEHTPARWQLGPQLPGSSPPAW